MRAITLTLATLALTLGVAAAAGAQDRPARAEAETTYDFEDHAVDGDYRRPLGEALNVRRGRGHTSLIRPRAHYVPELVTSIDAI